MPAQQLGIDFHPSLKILGIIFAAKTECREYKLGYHSLRSAGTGKTHILAQIVPGTTCTIRKYIPTAEAVVHRRRFATTSTLCSTTFSGMQLVQTARCRLPGTSFDTSSVENKGRLESLHIAAKCRTLLLYRMWILSRKADTITAAWMQRWHLMDTEENPPQRNKIPGKLHNLIIYVKDMAYI
jgi:hypothetical protein